MNRPGPGRRHHLRRFWEGVLLSYVALFHWVRPTTYLGRLTYILAGYLLFRWFEFQARRRGTLDVF